LVLLSFLVSSINAYAQQPETPEEIQIKQYRAEIGELTSRLPPSEAQDAHAAALASLRRKLRDLLIEKRGGVKRDIQVLRSTTSSPESRDYLARLEAVVSSITKEVDVLEVLTQSSRAIVSSVSPPAQPSPSPPSPPPSATPLPPDVELKSSAFQAVVSNLSAEQLRAATAPAELAATQLPQPGCNNAGRPTSTTLQIR